MDSVPDEDRPSRVFPGHWVMVTYPAGPHGQVVDAQGRPVSVSLKP